jgi:hypothetical protein
MRSSSGFPYVPPNAPASTDPDERGRPVVVYRSAAAAAGQTLRALVSSPAPTFTTPHGECSPGFQSLALHRALQPGARAPSWNRRVARSPRCNHGNMHRALPGRPSLSQARSTFRRCCLLSESSPARGGKGSIPSAGNRISQAAERGFFGPACFRARFGTAALGAVRKPFSAASFSLLLLDALRNTVVGVGVGRGAALPQVGQPLAQAVQIGVDDRDDDQRQ